MRILLISGHGAGQPGAIGNGYVEADLTREVTNILASKLNKFADTDIYDTSRNAYIDLENGKPAVNFANYDYVLEVHLNAGGGKGTEIYVTNKEEGTSVEQAIMNKLSQYFNVRGVKRKDFYVINSVKKKGVSSALLELCFIDNAEDINIYQNNKDGVAQAIADGIKEGFSLTQETKPKEPQATKSIIDLANEVIAGKYGTGEARKKSLGSLYNEVQAKVNEILLGKKTPVNKKSNETIANEVLEGKWGNGVDRKNELKKAGYDYNVIQKIVNQKLK